MDNDSPEHCWHVLIVNQHGDNRGDEAAMQAMMNSLADRLGNVCYSLIHQFRDADLPVRFQHQVSRHSMLLSVPDAARLVTFAALRRLGISMKWLLSGATRPMVTAYEQADLVISAPGGPYFGDIYRGHEVVHWFFIWLGSIYRRPLFLYAPSAGPFRTPVLNSIRRWLFAKFDVVCLRDATSAEYLRELCRDRCQPQVTADSALQQTLPPLGRSEYFTGERAPLADRFLVAVSALKFRYAGKDNVAEHQEAYKQTMARAIRHVADQRDAHFLLIPQLFGRFHSDVPYLEQLAAMFPAEVSWEIVDSACDSDMQRGIFAMCDLCIASRYHPQVFAAAAAVPGVCIYYEHKSLDLMQRLNMERFALDINTLNADDLCAALNDAMRRRDELSERLRTGVEPLRELSRRTTELAVELAIARRGSSAREGVAS